MLNIIIPYRNREEHLKQFLAETPKKLNVSDYRIYIIEQLNEKPFNRAMLMNIGFDLAKENGEQFCFHDVDMIPESSDYSDVSEPTHLVLKASQFGGFIPGHNYYGGVNMFNKESFIKINGYSNEFWGWGGEDDDLLKRVLTRGYRIIRRGGEYKSLAHKYNGPQHENYDKNVNKLHSNYDYNSDGLTNLRYELKNKIVSDIDNKATIYQVDF